METHAAEGSISSLVVLISKEINNSLHFQVTKMITTNLYSAAEVVDVAAVVGLEAVEAAEASTTPVAAASTTLEVASTTPVEEASTIDLVALIINHPLVEVASVVVIIMEADQPVSARVLEMLETDHHHQITKDTIPISKIFTIM